MRLSNPPIFTPSITIEGTSILPVIYCNCFLEIPFCSILISVYGYPLSSNTFFATTQAGHQSVVYIFISLTFISYHQRMLLFLFPFLLRNHFSFHQNIHKRVLLQLRYHSHLPTRQSINQFHYQD